MWLKKHYYVHVIKQFYEPDVEIVRSIVKPGDRVLDIGANAGWYTYLLSQCVGPSGHVTSIEPIPPTFEILTHCAKALKLTNVDLMNYAVSNEKGVVRMELPDFEDGGQNFYQARIVTPNPTRVGDGGFCVESRTLDDLFARDKKPIHFIKCDVEGHELSAIEGAENIITRDHPAWILEVSGDPDRQDSIAHRVVELLSDYGYTAHWFDGNAIRERVAGDISVNYCFITDEQREALRARGVLIVCASE
jgi:FkbM family methyltransferase